MNLTCNNCRNAWSVIPKPGVNKVTCPRCHYQMVIEWPQDELFPMARSSDPATSHEGAVQHREKLSERREQVLQLVVNHPGATQGELARQMLKRYNLPINVCAATPHKRLPELEKLGLVKRGEPRKCRDSGYNNATWWALDDHPRA